MGLENVRITGPTRRRWSFSSGAMLLLVGLVVPLSAAFGGNPQQRSSASSLPTAAQDILSAVPAKASVVVAVRDLAGLDAKLTRLMGRLGLAFSPSAAMNC